ncbi:hypothetical protein Tco_0633019 [Tanacetum coccineum]
MKGRSEDSFQLDYLRTMGIGTMKVKEVEVLENLKAVLGNEGFTDIDLRYMGEVEEGVSKSKDGVVSSEQNGKQSEDPFNIYSLFNKDKMKNNKEASTKESLEYPPGDASSDTLHKRAEVVKSIQESGSGGKEIGVENPNLVKMSSLIHFKNLFE